MALFLCAWLAHGQIASTPYWPSDVWRISSPERQGIDSRQLTLIFDIVRERRIPIHSVILIRNGYLVLEAYFYPFAKGTVHDLASVTKSVTSTLIGIAIDKGYIKGVDQRVLDFFPRGQFGPNGRTLETAHGAASADHDLRVLRGFSKR